MHECELNGDVRPGQFLLYVYANPILVMCFFFNWRYSLLSSWPPPVHIDITYQFGGFAIHLSVCCYDIELVDKLYTHDSVLYLAKILSNRSQTGVNTESS